MSTIVLRSVKGTPLTNTEVDDNFSNLNTDKIQIGGTYSSGTASGVLFLNGSKVLTTGSALTFDGAILGVNGVSVGRGAGAVSTNTAVGASALAANTSGSENAAFGSNALAANTSGYSNNAFGYGALDATTNSNNNSAFGDNALGATTTGNSNSAFGARALFSNTTGVDNTAIGYQAGYAATGSYMTAVGWKAGYSNQDAVIGNTYIGYAAGLNTTTGIAVNAIGQGSALDNTSGSFLAVMGNGALRYNTTGSAHVAIGYQALFSNTTASNNTAVGYQAGYSNQTGGNNTFLGYQAGFPATGSSGTIIGYQSGLALTSGANNTFVGFQSGATITTGAKNTILGGFNGNQGGLDIRTASNRVVLSDGDGNPVYIDDGADVVGINAIPNSGWGNWTGKSIIQFGDTGAYLHGGGSGWSGSNFLYAANTGYYNGTNFVRSNTLAGAARYTQAGGSHVFQSNTVSGSAGATISYATSLEFAAGYTLALEGASTQSGTGITFPATQSASSNANTLDDYEEGAWTPVPAGGATAGTYTAVDIIGHYTKVGRQVTVICAIYATSFTGTGDFYINGLPFTVSGSIPAICAVQFNENPFGNLLGGSSQIMGLLSGTSINFRACDNDTTSGAFNQLACSASTINYLRVTATYFV